MPFLVKDRAHLNRIEHKIFWPMIAPAIEAKGYKVIGFWENGIRHITNNVKPINTPADLKGLKIRTPKSHLARENVLGLGRQSDPDGLFRGLRCVSRPGLSTARKILTPTSMQPNSTKYKSI